VSPLALTSSNFPKVVTVLDSTIATSDSLFAVRAHSSSKSAFLSGPDIVAYLRSLESDETKIQEIDFAFLASAAPAAPSASGGGGTPAAAAVNAAVAAPADARIEGAPQIAIGVKKEVDFPTWYTNVSLLRYTIDQTLN
jgi:prolyl-tRNA synthetase